MTTTPITSLDNVDFVGSPKHLNITLASNNDPLLNQVSARIRLYIWQGNLSALPSTPQVVLEKAKVSNSDNYVTFEVAEYIASRINPTLLFNFNIATSNEGVFWQYSIEKVNSIGDPVGALYESTTRYATLGYKWSYEGQGAFNYNRGAFGFETVNLPKYYSPFINYYNKTINLSGATSTSTMITSTLVVKPPKYERCADEQFVIIYLNKQGFWDTFTPSGKVMTSVKLGRENYSRTFRDPLNYDPKQEHQNVDYNISSKQTIVINTGILEPIMGELVEEILYSHKVYLVEFKGDITSSADLTVDTTLISADTTLISADNNGSSTTGYITYKQTPVNITNSDFGRKTRLNDRNKISYNIQFEETYDKILNIR